MDEMMKEVRDVLDAERLVTARMVDSVLRTSQLAGIATPEMQDMFMQWLNLIGEQILSELNGRDAVECDLPALAGRVGVSETTLLSLFVYLQRSGRIRIGKLTLMEGTGRNTEDCGCLSD